MSLSQCLKKAVCLCELVVYQFNPSESRKMMNAVMVQIMI